MSTRAAWVTALLFAGVPSFVWGCSSDSSPSDGSGGSAAAGVGGGTSGTGGAAATGGTSASGGTSGIGGTSGSGGTAASGGSGGVGASGGSGGAGGAVGGTGGTGGAVGGSGGTGGGGDEFTLTSPNLEEGAMFADKYTCAAAGFNGSLSPALEWTAGPPGTQSYAITFIDVTLTDGAMPSDLGYHWVIYDIPANVTSLPEEFMDAASIGAQQNNAYLGPCPNFGGGSEMHDYVFTVYALDTPTLTINPTTGTGAVKDARTKLEANHLAKATLGGISNASPP